MKHLFMAFRKSAFFLLLFFIQLHAQKADLIIYSYDRPLQLYALLESIETYMTNVGSVQIIYRSSNEAYEQAYEQVWHDFEGLERYRQSDRPKEDFKPLTMQALARCEHDHVLFAVDDIIVKDVIDCDECIALMEQHNAYGFYLRMGKHLRFCYPYGKNTKQPLPRFIADDGHVCIWRFADGVLDWTYPNTVDMTIYRKEDVQKAFASFHFTMPNTLEGAWASRAGALRHRLGICYAVTKMVNLPLNRVQNDFHNAHMDFMSSQEMLNIFNDGKKIDTRPLHQINNLDAHMEYEPTFIERSA